MGEQMAIFDTSFSWKFKALEIKRKGIILSEFIDTEMVTEGRHVMQIYSVKTYYILYIKYLRFRSEKLTISWPNFISKVKYLKMKLVRSMLFFNFSKISQFSILNQFI